MKTLIEVLVEEFHKATPRQAGLDDPLGEFQRFAADWLDRHRPVGHFWTERNLGLRLRVPDEPLPLDCLLCPAVEEPKVEAQAIPIFGRQAA